MNQLQINCQKYVVVKELFIDTGDEDYIIARWCIFNRMSRQFFWNAAQAIEKYLKASLLLNGYSSKGYRHDLIALFCQVNRFAGGLIPQKLGAPKQVKLFADHSELWGDPATQEFIRRVNRYGNPSNRYNFFGFELEASDLYKLDQVVFPLRNIAVELEDKPNVNDLKDRINIGKTFFEIIRDHPDRQLFPFGEFLLKSKETAPVLYNAACENNFLFAPKYNHRELELIIHHNVSHLEILFSKIMRADSKAIINWAEKNIQFSKADILALNKQFLNPPFLREKKSVKKRQKKD